MFTISSLILLDLEWINILINLYDCVQPGSSTQQPVSDDIRTRVCKKAQKNEKSPGNDLTYFMYMIKSEANLII